MYLLFSPSSTFRFVETSMMVKGECGPLYGARIEGNFRLMFWGVRASMTQMQGKSRRDIKVEHSVS